MKKIHQQTVAQMREAYDSRAVHDQHIEEDFLREIAELEEKHNDKVEQLTDHYKSSFTKILSEFLMRKEEDETVILQLRDTLTQKIKEHEVNYAKIETEVEKKSRALVLEFQQKISKEKAQVELVLKDNEKLKKEYDTFEKVLLEKRKEVEDLHNLQELHLSEIEKIQKEKASLTREIKERNATIEEKELRALELKKKNQELSKFRFVLNFKIDELHQELSPYEEQIEQFVAQIEQMRSELLEHEKRYNELKISLRDLRLRISAADGQRNAHESKNKLLGSQIYALQLDLLKTLESSNDAKVLKSYILKLYRHYVSQETFNNTDVTRSVLDSNNSFDNPQRILDHHQKVVSSLETKKQKEIDRFSSKRAKLLSENSVLLETLNELTAELTHINIVKTSSEPSLDQLSREVQLQKITIGRLTERLQEVETTFRPKSRSKLPPLTSPR
ncbi:hypothetical protein GEMRC1_008132 [Eukaryota sp. GEM-RC1]